MRSMKNSRILPRTISLFSHILALFVAIQVITMISADAPLSGAPLAPGPQAEWKNGPPTDPSFFPVGVWLQEPGLAKRYKEAGINFYFALWRGPTPEQIQTLKDAGMLVICHQNEAALAMKDDPIIMGWMHGDEPDNAQRVPGNRREWGPAVPTEKIIGDYNEIRAKDPSRPVVLNLGQGVANDDFKGRAASYEDYPEYCKGADIVSFDVYPVTNIGKPDGEKYLWYVAKGLDRLKGWTKNQKPVWNVIECTHISNPDRKPTPRQVHSQVWMSIIHGSQGIVYFCHEFRPKSNDAALLDDPEMLEAVTKINRQIHELAPVLNSPSLSGNVEVQSSDKDIPVDGMIKEYEGSLYVFAASMRPGKTEGSFILKQKPDAAAVEVLGENRSITLSGDSFKDSFEDFGIHIYKISRQ